MTLDPVDPFGYQSFNRCLEMIGWTAGRCICVHAIGGEAEAETDA